MASSVQDAEFKAFTDLHQLQLKHLGVPEHLWPIVYQKVRTQTLDAGSVFQLQFEEGVGFSLVALKDLKKEQDVWLIDHAWTFEKAGARDKLKLAPPLVERFATMIGVVDEEEEEEEDPDHDHQYPDHSHDHVEHIEVKDDKKADDDNSVAVDQSAIDALVKETGVNPAKAVEIFKSKQGDLVEAMMACQIAVEESKADTGNTDASADKDKSAAAEAKDEQPVLSGDALEKKLDLVMGKLFDGLSHTYRVVKPSGDGGTHTLYYVMDEVGSAIGTSDSPNAKVGPFVCLQLESMAFNLLFLTKDVATGEVITAPPF